MFLRLSLLFLAFASFKLCANEEKKPITHRIPQFENEYVKVWKTIVMPNQPLKMHRHDNKRIVVGLKGGVLRKIDERGEISDLVFETGKAYWFDEDLSDSHHADVNETNEPIEVMVIEINK